MIGHQNSSEPVWFLKIALIAGVLLALLTPPMCTPDENAHYMNAYSISCGDFFPEVVDGQIGRYVSTKVLAFKNKYTGKYTGKFDIGYSFGAAYFDSWLPNKDGSETFYASSLTTISPIGYLVSGSGMAVGMYVGNLFEPEVNGLPYNLMLYGRFANLIYYITVIYWALRITPHYKKTMLIIASMPMSIFLGASLNYDAVLIPTTILLIAVILRLIDEEYERVRYSDAAMVLLCTFVLVGVKLAYAPFLILLLAVPKKKYGGQRQLYIYIILVIVTAILAYIPSLISNSIGSKVVDDYAEIVAAQHTYIRENWFLLPKIFLTTLRMYRGFYLEGFWGKLGQIDTNFPVPLLVSFYAVLLFVAVCDSCSVNIWKTGGWKRILPALGFCISLCGIFFQMYSSWTAKVVEVGAQYVSGVQGRYLIPLFLPFLLCLSNNIVGRIRIQKHMADLSTHLAKGCAAICGVLSVLIIYARYWNI